MDAGTIEESYLKLTKNYLLISGIWPSQNKYVQYICRFIIYVALVLSIITQVMRVTHYFCLDVLVEQLPFLLASLLALVKQGTYIVNDEKLHTLLTGMFNDWTIDKSEEELDIMTSYMDRGVLFATIYTASGYGTLILFAQLPWWPRIADILMPLNASRPRAYVIPAYYPIDVDQYYYWIILQMTLTILITTIVYIACDTCFIYAVQHACGLFAISGHRFKEAQRDVSARSTVPYLSTETYQKVCRSVMAHDRALTFLREIEDIHFGYLLICLGIITGAFSGTLALLSRLNLCMQFYQCAGFLVVQLMHLLFLTIQGQFVIDSNWKAYNNIYEGLWYKTTPKTQMFYMQALRAAITAPQLTAGRRIPMNLETFSSIIKASVSYFTMLKAT